MKTKKLKKVEKVMFSQIKLIGQTTTLAVKEQLRILYPDKKWNQTDISMAMIDISNENNVPFTDNGKYRTYFEPGTNVNPVTLPATKTKAKKNDVKKTKKSNVLDLTNAIKISKSNAVQKIKDSKGRFFTVGFIKADGKTERFLNGVVKASNFMNNQGYINVTESNGNKRQVNPKTIFALSIGKVIYKTK